MSRVEAADRCREERPYDLIVIGSGMGGLTVASLAARLRGQRVLVLEQHFKAGGFTHSFQRQQYHWDVGLHYVGEMGPGATPAKLMSLITGGQVRWNPMPDRFEKFVYPDFSFDLQRGAKRFEADLLRQFPAEARGIRRYFGDVRRAAAAITCWYLRRNGSAVARFFGKLGGWIRPPRWQLSTHDYLARSFEDVRLRALLASQWGDYGLPPRQSPFSLHALIVRHYFDGGYYPQGGAGGIARAVQRIVERAGGRIVVGREVTEIVIEQGRAVGVISRKTSDPASALECHRADAIVSDAGAAVTFQQLVPERQAAAGRQAIGRLLADHPAMTNVTLYLGLNEHPGRLGFQGENHWIYSDIDHERMFRRRATWIDDGQVPGVYLSFPSLKDPAARSHTAEIISWADYATFARWREQPWRNRDEEYQHLKQRIAKLLLEFVDRRYPGFASLVAYQELSTPLSSEHFTRQPRGAIYGLPAVAERFAPEIDRWANPRTPIAGLYLTGTDAGGLGIVGAMMGGVTVVGHLPNAISTPEILRAARKTGG